MQAGLGWVALEQLRSNGRDLPILPEINTWVCRPRRDGSSTGSVSKGSGARLLVELKVAAAAN